MDSVEKLMIKIMDLRDGNTTLTAEAKAMGLTKGVVLDRLKADLVKSVAYMYRRRTGEALPTKNYREAYLIFKKRLS
nr:MAG TPA: hypothetical protein [Caudoviricetes sp.]